jgi:hypothetical protein
MHTFNITLPHKLLVKSDNSLKKKAGEKVGFNCNTQSKNQQKGLETRRLLQHTQKCGEFLSYVLFCLNRGYFDQAQVIFTL